MKVGEPPVKKLAKKAEYARFGLSATFVNCSSTPLNSSGVVGELHIRKIVEEQR